MHSEQRFERRGLRENANQRLSDNSAHQDLLQAGGSEKLDVQSKVRVAADHSLHALVPAERN